MNDHVVECEADFFTRFLFWLSRSDFFAYIVNFGVVFAFLFNGFLRLSDFMFGDFVLYAIRAEADNAGKSQSRRKNGEKQ